MVLHVSCNEKTQSMSLLDRQCMEGSPYTSDRWGVSLLTASQQPPANWLEMKDVRLENKHAVLADGSSAFSTENSVLARNRWFVNACKLLLLGKL